MGDAHFELVMRLGDKALSSSHALIVFDFICIILSVAVLYPIVVFQAKNLWC